MATITAPGSGSGLDINSIVNQLMALERQPLKLVQSKLQQTQTQISSYGQLKSDISSLQTAAQSLKDANAFNVFSAASSNKDLLTATASGNATPGTYNITVNTTAKTQTLASVSTYADKTAAQASAATTLSFTINGQAPAKTVDVASGASLEGIRDAVNSSDIGVSATIINAGTSASPAYKLVFMTKDPGTANQITQIDAAVAGDSANNGGLDFVEFGTGQPTNMESKQTASDASVTINGITVTSDTNTITDALDGVTLNVVKEGSMTLTVQRDQEAVDKKVQGFVDAYNTVISKVGSLRNGALKGDSTVLSVQNQLASVLQLPVGSLLGSTYSYLSEVGITIQKDGKLGLDKTKFHDAFNSNGENVKKLFQNSSSDGFMDQFDLRTRQLLESGGLLDGRTSGLQASVKRYEMQQESLEYRLEQTEARLKAKFNAMDSAVAQMRNTGSYLLAQLGS